MNNELWIVVEILDYPSDATSSYFGPFETNEDAVVWAQAKYDKCGFHNWYTTNLSDPN